MARLMNLCPSCNADLYVREGSDRIEVACCRCSWSRGGKDYLSACLGGASMDGSIQGTDVDEVKQRRRIAELERYVKYLKAIKKAGNWRKEPPTEEEVRLHFEAHHTPSGECLWLVWRDDYAVPFVLPKRPDLLIDHPLSSSLCRWRPLDADGVACEWPSSIRDSEDIVRTIEDGGIKS